MTFFVSMSELMKAAFGGGKNSGASNAPITEDLTQLSQDGYLQRMQQLAKR